MRKLEVSVYKGISVHRIRMQVLGAVHFEKCLPDSFHAISATTSRMALRDSLINSRDPSRFCKNYLNELEPIIDRLEQSSNVHLKEQPVFEWLLNDEPYFSPCWQFEHLMLLRCLSLHLMAEGKKLLVESSFKEAKKLFEEAIGVCKSARDGPARKWTFKDIPTLQCSYPEYWDQEIGRCDSYCKLASFQFAISSGHVDNKKSNKILEIVCTRMLKSAEVGFNQGHDIRRLYDLGYILRAYLHADSLWSEKNYPDALALTAYERVSKPEVPEAHVLLKWAADQEAVFQTWRRECQQVHFVTASDAMPEVPL